MFVIRQAELKDIPDITEIYNEAILNTVATFDVEPKTEGEQMAWFASHHFKNPILVAELDGVVVGWASLSKWSVRRAYSDTAEISLYAREGYRGRGIGKKLLEAIVRKGEEVGLHTIIARITEDNGESIRLHKSSGFKDIGIMREVGRKFGKVLDVRLMQKIYPLKN